MPSPFPSSPRVASVRSNTSRKASATATPRPCLRPRFSISGHTALPRPRRTCHRRGFPCGFDGGPPPVFSLMNRWLDELSALYAQPGRHYHNLAHIDALLAHFAVVLDIVDAPAAVELAI